MNSNDYASAFIKEALQSVESATLQQEQGVDPITLPLTLSILNDLRHLDEMFNLIR